MQNKQTNKLKKKKKKCIETSCPNNKEKKMSKDQQLPQDRYFSI